MSGQSSLGYHNIVAAVAMHVAGHPAVARAMAPGREFEGCELSLDGLEYMLVQPMSHKNWMAGSH